ncbi:hypothetical protein Hanom_Chr01g00024691 [Helianthus anomalus]
MLGFADKGFEVMLGLSIANTEYITPPAERVGNNICFAWVVTNLAVVIVEKFYP